jgi:hypothetical protein
MRRRPERYAFRDFDFTSICDEDQASARVPRVLSFNILQKVMPMLDAWQFQ